MDDSINITWTNKVDFIDLFVSYDGGNNFILIEENIDASLGSYLWPVPMSSFNMDIIFKIQYSSNASVLSQSESIPVYLLPTVNLGNDTTLVDGQMIELNAGNDGADFLWSTGATTQTIMIDIPGVYAVTVTSEQGCSSEDEIEINFTTGTDDLINLSFFAITPNPTNTPIQLSFELSNAENVQLDLFDAKGQLTERINFGRQNQGIHLKSMNFEK